MRSKEFFINQMNTIVNFVDLIEKLDSAVGLSIEGNLYNICFDLINNMEDEYESQEFLVDKDWLPLIGDWVWEFKCGKQYPNDSGVREYLVEVNGKEYSPKTPEELYETLKDVYDY